MTREDALFAMSAEDAARLLEWYMMACRNATIAPGPNTIALAKRLRVWLDRQNEQRAMLTRIDSYLGGETPR